MKFSRLIVLASMVLCSAITSLPAAVVSFTFRGAVTDVPASLSSQFAVGQVISGTYSFESTTAATGNNYLMAVTVFDATIGNYGISQTGLGDISIVNGATDEYIVVSFSTGDAVGTAGTPVIHALQFTDPTGTAFSGTSLPITPPDVAAFASPLFTLDFSSGGRLTGRIDTLAVPEPSSLLALSGVGCVGFVHRRRRTITT